MKDSPSDDQGKENVDEGSSVDAGSSPSPTPAAPIDPDRTKDQPVSLLPSFSGTDSSTETRIKKSKTDRKRIRLALHRSPYFTCLDEEQVERFINVAKLEEFRPGQAVILEGCRDERGDGDGGGTLQELQPNVDQVQLSRRLSTDGYADSDEYILLDGDGEEIRVKESQSESVASEVAEEEEGISSTSEGISVELSQIDGQSTQPQLQHSEYIMSSEDNDNYTGNEATMTQSSPSSVIPPAPMSGKKSYIYIVHKGTADVFYDTMTPASLGPGSIFGEGGFLFGLPHSASIVARSPLECWVIDYGTFCSEVLPSGNMKNLFNKYATTRPDNDDSKTSNSDSSGIDESYMTMDDFIQSCLDTSSSNVVSDEPSDGISASNVASSSIESTFQNLRVLTKQHIPSSPSLNSATNSNRVHFTEFCLFHLLMARPDPEVDIAFLLMDRSRTGHITLEDFVSYIENGPFPYFDLESEFVKRHFGPSGQRTIRNIQFSQFLLDLQREMGRQTFLHAANRHHEQRQNDTSLMSTMRRQNDDGFLPPEEFINVLKSACGWRLPEGVVERLELIYGDGSTLEAGATEPLTKQATDIAMRSILSDQELLGSMIGTRKFSYGDFLAFQEVLERLPGIVNVIDHACKITKGQISQDDFKVANRVIGLGGRLSRRQVDIIFQMFDLDRDGFISVDDAVGVIGSDFAYRLEPTTGRQGKVTFAPPPDHRANHRIPSASKNGSASEEDQGPFGQKPQHRQDDDMLAQLFQTMTQFMLASIAGSIGTLVVYPLDLVKTRMMNQRIGPNGEGRMYLHSLHCLSKTFRYEGFEGLYRGLLPPLLAVGPERTIKFLVNDLLRGLSAKQNGYPWWMEILSGGCAGACQLLVTNPFEIIKIRLQLQGETARILKSKGLPVPRPMSFSRVAADLGTSGLFKGAAACLLRDVPFGAIYFPAYAACKDYLVRREYSGYASASNLLLAGTIAAVPAALLTTPADMVKTRLQVVPRAGETTYSGIGDCIRKVYELEGPTAFFKGSAFRVARIAPQFGISLLCYEKLSEVVGFKEAMSLTNVPIDPQDYRSAFPTRAVGTKTEDISDLVRNMGFQPKPPR